MEKRWHYLSYRIQILCIGVFAFWTFSVLGVWIYVVKTGRCMQIAGICTGAFFISLCFLYFAVCKPYQRVDKNLNLFLMGYTSTGMKEESCMLSPSTEELTKILIRLIESDQLLNANKRQAQYLALQNQINPHFLYKTLVDTLNPCVECIESAAADGKDYAAFILYS